MHDWGIIESKKRKRSASMGAEDVTDSKKSDSSGNKPWLSHSDSSKNVYQKGNHVYFYASVTKESIYRMNESLIKLNREFKDLQQRNPTVTMQPDPIYLHINSYGGSVFAAYAAIDFIKQSAIPVHTIVEGATASAGTLMSVVGKKRYIRPHAVMLIHQLSSWLGGKMTEIEDSFQNLEQMMAVIKGVYTEHSKLSGEELDNFLKHDLWWHADKCMEHGLVDELWKGN
jgi:ATP-dependent protease ClpP protease subunit